MHDFPLNIDSPDCRLATDSEVDWERVYNMETHEEAVMAHHREFRKIVKK